jgi:hypothetical protein
MKSLSRPFGAVCFLSALLVAAPAWSEVRLTELRIATDPAIAEVFNSGPGVVDLTGWVIRNQSGTSITALSGNISVGQHRTFNLNGNVQKRGDILELFDPALESLADRVRFGDSGGAPLDVASVPTSSISRTGGTADPTGITSATNWTVDFTSTLGSANNAPAAQFNREVLINELIPVGATIRAELFNNTNGTVNLANYRLTTGIGQLMLSGMVPAGGFATFDITPINFEFSLNLYLFRADEVRLDQIGLSDAPGVQTTWLLTKGSGQSLGRCPDGAGSQMGFDLSSSGYPVNLRQMAPTSGTANSCSSVVAVHVPVRWPALAAAAVACWAIASGILRRRAGIGLAGGRPRE